MMDIGQLGSYQNIYVAACGQQLAGHREGVEHERACQACLTVVAEDECEAQLEKMVYHETIGKKQVPMLVWPDGSRIHLMPYVISGGQDPVEQLRRWVNAWMDEA